MLTLGKKLKKLTSCNQFHGISVAPDRSYQERQKYHQLRLEMNQRNTELLQNGAVNVIWIIRKMSLEKVLVKHNKE